MTRYKNLNGDSGVFAYEVGIDRIVVQFNSGHVYLYTNGATGGGNIENMKSLAEQGKGLGSHINKHVRKKYAKRIK